MNTSFVYQCGVMWRNYRSDEARSRLVDALSSTDPDIAWLAYAMLQRETANA